MAGRARRWYRWILGVVVAVLVLAVAGPLIAFHFIVSPAPPPLALPGVTGTVSQALPSGVWSAGPGSLAGYRIRQVVIGQHSTVTGRTGQVWGSMRISGATVNTAVFTVSMTAITGNSKLGGAAVMDTAAYPTARFVLTRPISLDTVPSGVVRRYAAAGTLTMHGVTVPVRLTLLAERAASGIYVLADIPVAFADWHIAFGGSSWLAGIDSPGTVEVLVHLVQGTGNPSAVPAPGGAHS